MAVGKQLTGQYNQFNQDTSQASGKYGDTGSWTYNNIINPGLASYSALLTRLSNPDAVQQTSDKMSGNLDQYTSRVNQMFDNAGYSPEEKQNMRFATDAGIAGAYAGAHDDLAQRGAATNNTAAYGAQEGQLARQKAADIAGNRANLEGSFANARIGGQQNALQNSQFVPQMQQNYMNSQDQLAQQFQFSPGLGAQVYGTDTSGAVGMAGNQGQALGSRSSAAAQPGFWSRLISAGVEGGASVATAGIAGSKGH